MCGITGVFDGKKAIDRDTFTGLNNLLSHRGPDDGQCWIAENRQFALGFRRLAIIDTSERAQQPIANEDGKLHLVCNGEIYNYKELKKLLVESGHIFTSSSDTEVILHGYEEWGVDIFPKLNGMFSIAIVDQTNESIILARDRFGIKPLYYQVNKDSIIFSSELRPIVAFHKPKINRSAIINYLIYRYIPAPETIYEDVYKLPPARFMIIDRKLGFSISEYWSINVAEKKENEADFSRKIGEMLQRSVGEHMIGEEAIGAFLSGGYDSSYIALKMKEMGKSPMSFSIGFRNWSQSEDVFAAEVAKSLQIPNTSELISEEEFLSEQIISAWDEPIADISIIPTFRVCSLAARTHKVVLSGDGADEVLGGYNWYYEVAQQIADTKKSFFKRPDFHKMALDTYCRYTAMGLYSKEILKETLHSDLHSKIPEDIFWLYKHNLNKDIPVLKSLQLLDIRTFLPELILPKMDRASMANSLEVRPAFLDHRIAEEIFSHESSLYFSKEQYKKILFNELKGKIPDNILARKKQGFTGSDLFYDRPDFYRQLFNKSRLVEEGIINPEIIGKFIEGKMPWHLWKLAVLEMWFARFEK